jgi:hypothetical protein
MKAQLEEYEVKIKTMIAELEEQSKRHMSEMN